MAMDSLELWGGYECTVNRVGDEWFDQTPRSGHEDRIEDLQLFAGPGMRSLRYPALWERGSLRAGTSGSQAYHARRLSSYEQ